MLNQLRAKLEAMKTKQNDSPQPIQTDFFNSITHYPNPTKQNLGETQTAFFHPSPVQNISIATLLR